MSLLETDEILKLHRIALSFHLEDARDELLAGIDPAVVNQLPSELTASEQLLSDLAKLNWIGALPGGSIPLRIWISNAAARVPRAAVAAFSEALQAVDLALAAGSESSAPILETASASDHVAIPSDAPKQISSKTPPPGAPVPIPPGPPPTRPITASIPYRSGEARMQSIAHPGEPTYRGGRGAPPKASERIVSTGFSAAETPIKALFGDACLEPGRAYYYWLEVGAQVAGSIEITPVPLPVELLPQNAELTVVLFSNPGGLEISPTADMGVLRLQPSGDVIVARPASVPPAIASQAELLATRLFFPVKAPAKEGVYLLRSCIYHRGTLVQSREVRARVARGGRADMRALSSRVDYTLSRTLAPTALRALGQHKLSILLNAGENGTHGFRFFGEGDYRRSATFDGHEVQSLITSLRGSLRRVSWGSSDAWKPDMPYRFDQEPTFHSLLGDLIDMAKEGARAYDAIARRLGGDAQGEEVLREAMRRPGLVQLALKKESSRLVLPLAMMFDHQLDTWLDPGDYHLCEAFQAATVGGAPLEQKPCFLGDCPSRDVDTAICPSGFWGFRHALGVPMTLVNEREGEASPDLEDPLPRGEGPSVTVAVCTDPQMQERDRHVRALLDLFDPARSRVAETRQDAIKALRDITAHIVYFYCHGGTQGEARVPYIQVGPMTDPPIGRDTLRNSKIRWPSPRPLVFINGCHTTDLEPDRAIDLVSGFVETAGASGVIGTEITVFEPLATAFAERFMEAFLRDGHPVGEAVRRARLHLLQKGLNPLGLVYVPFAVASLKLS